MNSIWRQTAPALPDYPALDRDLSCGAVVIGGGMAGILTAWALEKRGVDTVLLEAQTPACGVTADTTAKITSQHGLIYHRLITSLGEARARQYAAANQQAIEDYASLAETLGIDCDFQRAPAYVYDRKDTKVLTLEAAAANRLGIPAAVTGDVELPFPVAGAVMFPDQAMFHPLKFLSALLPKLQIYAHTTARSIEAGAVHTDHGTVRARHIVVTTHFPFFQLPGLYFARMHQDRSYVLALSGAAPIEGMYLDASPMGLSLRPWRNQLLLGGGGHRTGKTPGSDGYQVLEAAAKRYWPDAKVTARWSAQDCMPMDGVPYIGAYREDHSVLYVATGFQKWGMSTSMAAARILSSQITGAADPNAEVFSPHRLPTLSGLANLVKDGGISASHLFSQAFYVPKAQLRDIPPGHGGVVRWKGHAVGAYRDESGRYYLVPTRCPHLGCQLSWNAAERTWDCPCHGSRFSFRGQRLEAPATDDLSCQRLAQTNTARKDR